MAVDARRASADRPALRRTLSLTHAVLYGLGVTIGAGIYVLVGVAAGRSGVHAPLAFVGAALVMSFTAATFAELGTRMPVSASEAAYVDAAFAREWLTLGVGLLVVATACISAATISAGSAGYLSVFVPLRGELIVAGVVVAMGVVASLSTVQSVSFAGVMTVVEVGGLVLIVGAGLAHGTQVAAALPALWPSAGDTAAWLALGGTSLIAVFAFIGFEHLVNVAEELRDPARTLPRALFLTLGLTALIYALVVWISVTSVPPAELARSPAPLALVFQRLTGLPLATMSAVAVVATLNGVIVHMIMIARVLYGLASLGRLPRALARVHGATGTPLVATGAGVAVILVLALAVPLEGLADLTARCTLAIFAMVNLALLRIKSREARPPAGVFVCPRWVPAAGLASTVLLVALDVALR